MYYGGMGGGWWVFLLMWLLIVIAVAVVVWLIIRSTRSAGPAQQIFHAEELLRERFARGEISEEAFERGMESLRRSRG